jgi:hypothetical protein
MEMTNGSVDWGRKCFTCHHDAADRYVNAATLSMKDAEVKVK